MAQNQIFLTYSLADSDTARQVVQAIEDRGWPISWERYESPDAVASLALGEALKASSCAVVLWSKHSIQAKDVLEEAKVARSRGILVQAALDDAPVPMPFVLDEPTRLTDKWSIATLVRQVARALEGEPTPPIEKDSPGEDGEDDDLSPRILEDAEAHADAGALRQAITLYERWIAARPHDMKAVRRLGDLFLSADRESEAASQYAKVAEQYASSGLLVPAIETYRRIVGLAPYVDAFQERLAELSEKKRLQDTKPELSMAGVQFTVTAPPYVRAGEGFAVEVWSHHPEDRDRIPIEPSVTRSGSSSSLAARLHMDGLDVDESNDSFVWEEGLGSARFHVGVPEDAVAGSRSGTIGVHLMGLQIARVHFNVQLGGATAPHGRIPTRQEQHRRAIAVFAPDDRERVSSRIHAFEKALPGVDIFMDTFDLLEHRDGLSRFLDLVGGSDVLYLFWSENAARSRDVEREWRYALRLRGVDFIDAVPLDPPEAAPPPEELAMLHGGDWQRAYESASPRERPPRPEAGI